MKKTSNIRSVKIFVNDVHHEVGRDHVIELFESF